MFEFDVLKFFVDVEIYKEFEGIQLFFLLDTQRNSYVALSSFGRSRSNLEIFQTSLWYTIDQEDLLRDCQIKSLSIIQKLT